MEKGKSSPTILAGCLTSSSDNSLSVHPGAGSSSRWLKSSSAMRYRCQPSISARTAMIFLRWSCSFAGPAKSTPTTVSTLFMLWLDPTTVPNHPQGVRSWTRGHL